MSKRSDHVYIKDIAESIDTILNYVGETTEYEFCTNMMMQE